METWVFPAPKQRVICWSCPGRARLLFHYVHCVYEGGGSAEGSLLEWWTRPEVHGGRSTFGSSATASCCPAVSGGGPLSRLARGPPHARAILISYPVQHQRTRWSSSDMLVLGFGTPKSSLLCYPSKTMVGVWKHRSSPHQSNV